MSRPLPALRPRQVIRALERAGFVLIQIKASHHYFEHPGRRQALVCVPIHPGDLKRPVVRSFLRPADLTAEVHHLDLDEKSRPVGLEIDHAQACTRPRDARYRGSAAAPTARGHAVG